MEKCSEPVEWLTVIVLLLHGRILLVSASADAETIETVGGARAREQEEEEEGLGRRGAVGWGRRESDRRGIAARRR